jgi:hypothetical protein
MSFLTVPIRPKGSPILLPRNGIPRYDPPHTPQGIRAETCTPAEPALPRTASGAWTTQLVLLALTLLVGVLTVVPVAQPGCRAAFTSFVWLLSPSVVATTMLLL